MSDRNITVHELLQQLKRESFTDAEKATDAEAMGLLMSHYFQWDGISILKAAYSGLEDANFHTENETIEKLIERAEKDYQ